MRRHAFRLYRHYIAINIRSAMQYKSSFWLTMLGQLLATVSTLFGIIFMFQRFHVIKGFTINEVILTSGIVQMQFSLAEMWARGFDHFSVMIRKGDYDRVLLRPRNEILQVFGSQFELSRIGRLIQGMLMLLYGIIRIKIRWDFLKVLTLINMILGGTALFTGISIIRAALCFFTLEGLEFMNIFTDGAREHGKYPLNIYGDKFLLFCTVAIPYALVQYYPLIYILGQRSSPWFVFLPLLTFLYLFPCIALFRFGVRHYQSSGS